MREEVVVSIRERLRFAKRRSFGTVISVSGWNARIGPFIACARVSTIAAINETEPRKEEREVTEGWVTTTPLQVPGARLEFGAAILLAADKVVDILEGYRGNEAFYPGSMLPTKGEYGCSNEDGDDGDDASVSSFGLFFSSFLPFIISIPARITAPVVGMHSLNE